MSVTVHLALTLAFTTQSNRADVTFYIKVTVVSFTFKNCVDVASTDIYWIM